MQQLVGLLQNDIISPDFQKWKLNYDEENKHDKYGRLSSMDVSCGHCYTINDENGKQTKTKIHHH